MVDAGGQAGEYMKCYCIAFLGDNFLENGHLEDQEWDWRIKWRLVLGIYLREDGTSSGWSEVAGFVLTVLIYATTVLSVSHW